MAEIYSSAEASAAAATTEHLSRAGEIINSLSFEALNQKPQEGPGFSFLQGWVDGGIDQTRFEIRHYPPKGDTPKRKELIIVKRSPPSRYETFTIAGDGDKYTYWREPKLLMIEKGASIIYPPTEVRDSIDRLAELAQKIKANAKFN